MYKHMNTNNHQVKDMMEKRTYSRKHNTDKILG